MAKHTLKTLWFEHRKILMKNEKLMKKHFEVRLVEYDVL